MIKKLNKTPDNKKTSQQWLGGFQFKSWRWLTLTWQVPHYHQREEVSLLSSGRDQVVHSCYCRQQTVMDTCFGLTYAKAFSKWVINGLVNWVEFYVLAFTKSSSLFQIRINWSFMNRFKLYIQLLGCCIVKPHEQLVLVSFTYHYASTSNLSTS